MTAPDAPERVWVSPLGVFDVEMGGSIAYVPESRALAAEAERDEARTAWAENQVAFRELRAERDALVPLARWAVALRDNGLLGAGTIEREHLLYALGEYGVNDEVVAAARRVLDKEGT